MNETGEVLTIPKLETTTPEKNTLEKFTYLFYQLSAITSKSRLPGTESSRPLSLRAKRAELYGQVQEARQTKNREEVKTILDEAHLRDEIATQYLTQGEVKIDLKELGLQKARYTEVKPPAELDKHLPPIYLIPGISNDLDCVGWLIQEMAKQGRTVLCVGFPESYMGETTEEFAKAVENSEGYGSHTQFFQAVLNTLVLNNQDAELWGFSTGAPIVAEMLQKPEIQNRTAAAVLLSPASSIDQTTVSFYSGIVDESIKLAKELKSIAKYTLSSGRKELDEIAREDSTQREIKNKILNILLKKVQKRTEAWKTAKVKEEGTITIVSGDKDNVTKSSVEFVDEQKLQIENSQIRLLRISDAHHSTPLIHPERILPQIFEAQALRKSELHPK